MKTMEGITLKDVQAVYGGPAGDLTSIARAAAPLSRAWFKRYPEFSDAKYKYPAMPSSRAPWAQPSWHSNKRHK